MDPILFALIVLIAGGVPLVAYLFYTSRGRASRAVIERVRHIREPERSRPAPAAETQAAERELFPTLGKFIAGRSYTQRLLDDLGRAGWRLKPSEYVGMSLGITGVAAIVGTLMTSNMLGGLVGGVIGYMIPRVMLNMSAGKRKAALDAQIPDMVWLISSALKSGYSFLRALQVVTREMAEPISSVAKKVVDECQFGVPMEDALQRMADRIRSYDLGLVVTAVVIQSQVGGSLAQVLDSIAETIKERIQIQGEVASLTAEGRISGVVLIALTPLLAGFFMIANPGYIGILVKEPMGIKMVIAALVLQAIGIWWIKKMIKIEV